MEHITVGRKHNEGKIALAECVGCGDLKSIDIKDKCFLLIILTKGRLKFEVGGEAVTAAAHDMFLLKPFTDKALVIPICESQLEKTERANKGYCKYDGL